MNQSGRSMIEMLGVLAIVGVLSVGALKGYSYAMNKHEANEVYSRVIEITEEIMSLYAENGVKYGFDEDDLIKAGIIHDAELVDNGSGGYWIMIGPGYLSTNKVKHYPGMVYSHTSVVVKYGLFISNKALCYKMMAAANTMGDVDRLGLLYYDAGQKSKDYYVDKSYPAEDRLPVSLSDIFAYCDKDKDYNFMQFSYYFYLR